VQTRRSPATSFDKQPRASLSHLSPAGQQGDLRVLSRWFGNKQESDSSACIPGLTGPKVPRHSGGWAALRKRLEAEPGLRVIDIGSTSPTNINYLTELGHSVFLANVVGDACTGNWKRGEDEDGSPVWDVEGFLAQSLNFADRKFDVVLLWTTLDYLPEALVAPVVERLFEATNPDGQVLAFFHTRTQGEETAYCRIHVTASDDVEMQLAQQFPIQRAFTNRSIQQLFAAWSGFRQFLAKDSVSEVIITR
jgi:SAM-dependent methyltransferase